MWSGNNSLIPLISGNQTDHSLSTTNTSCLSPMSPSMHAELTAWMATTLTVTLLGAVFDILILIISFRSLMHSKSGLRLPLFHYLLVNLFVCLVTVPSCILLVMLTRRGYKLWSSACDLVQSLQVVAVAVVNWADAGLAVDRYVALFHPHHYTTWTGGKVNLILIVFYWLICFGAMVPFIFHVSGSQIVRMPVGHCVLMASSRILQMSAALTTYLPFIIAAGFGLMILAKSCGFFTIHEGSVSPATVDRTMARRLRMAKRVMVTLVWSGLCQAPFLVIGLQFPQVYRVNPTAALWTKTALPFQYGLTPVCQYIIHMCKNFSF